jgi:pre-60S factor REI1
MLLMHAGEQRPLQNIPKTFQRFALPLVTKKSVSLLYRYNLKRKIAGLPPVTKEWYEARRAQLAASASGPLQRIWLDPLTKKKFYSENTYQAFTRSKKYLDLVKRSGKAAPAAVVTVRRLNEGAAPSEAPAQPAAAPAVPLPVGANPTGFTVKPAVYGGPAAAAAKARQTSGNEQDQEDSAGGDNSGDDWETASEEEMEGSQKEWEEWDVCRSLFDNHISPSMEENLEYMWRKFGFYLPDSEFLEDPEGMLKYLGAKLQYGHIPLYESGNNPKAKQMASLHGVQRHMVDVGKCKVLYDDNEEEYEDFYNYEKEEMDVDGNPTDRQLVSIDAEDAVAAGGGYELALPQSKGGVRVLGSREFARYYKQRHKAGDSRESTAAARVLAQYRKLSVPLIGDGTEASIEKKRAQRAVVRAQRDWMNVSIRRNVNDNLPRNVPY